MENQTMTINFNTPEVHAPSISSSAMLVELGISTWTAKKKDKGATAELLTQKNAARSAGNFNKNLLADCEELAAIQKFASNVRTAHYHMTMPWSDSGLRALPTAKYFDYHQAMTALQGEFYSLVEKFLSKYEWEVMQVHAKLGDLFDRDEYPTVETVRGKFNFRLSYIPVPDAGDWRIDLETEAAASLKEQYETFYAAQMEGAMRDIWQRLYEHLDRFIRQLGEDAEGRKGKLYDSTIENVRHFAEMMEHVNYTNDPNLQLAQRRLTAHLAGVCKDDLVRNEGFRAETKRTMEEVMKSLPSLDL
jgi:hypothetical protein